MIKTKNIRKSFGALEVLKGIDLTVGRAEVVSIVGPSGAGKTTLLQIIGTLSRPDSGEIVIDGIPVHTLADREISRFRNTKIGFVFQFHHLLPEFTSLENVMIPAFIAGTDRMTAHERGGVHGFFPGRVNRFDSNNALPGRDQKGVPVGEQDGSRSVRTVRPVTGHFAFFKLRGRLALQGLSCSASRISKRLRYSYDGVACADEIFS